MIASDKETTPQGNNYTQHDIVELEGRALRRDIVELEGPARRRRTAPQPPVIILNEFELDVLNVSKCALQFKSSKPAFWGWGPSARPPVLLVVGELLPRLEVPEALALLGL